MKMTTISTNVRTCMNGMWSILAPIVMTAPRINPTIIQRTADQIIFRQHRCGGDLMKTNSLNGRNAPRRFRRPDQRQLPPTAARIAPVIPGRRMEREFFPRQIAELADREAWEENRSGSFPTAGRQMLSSREILYLISGQ